MLLRLASAAAMHARSNPDDDTVRLQFQNALTGLQLGMVTPADLRRQAASRPTKDRNAYDLAVMGQALPECAERVAQFEPALH